MGRNVEIKAKIESVSDLLPAVRKIAMGGPQDLSQDDTFFFCADGRLKLRILEPDKGELIFYQRADKSGPKESTYTIARISEPYQLRELLVQAYGASGRVQKHRTVYMSGNTRIHLDSVDGLGEFLELEVVLSDSETVEDGIKTANDVLLKLGISGDQLIEGAYVDLIAQQLKAKEA